MVGIADTVVVVAIDPHVIGGYPRRRAGGSGRMASPSEVNAAKDDDTVSVAPFLRREKLLQKCEMFDFRLFFIDL